jgi:hypothetical protein
MIFMKRIMFLCFGILLVGVILYLQRNSGAQAALKQMVMEACLSIEESAMKLFKYARSLAS